MSNKYTYLGRFLIALVLLIDVMVYIFFGLVLMGYEDNYHVNKGAFESWGSLTNFEKTAFVSFEIWNVINIILIVFIVYKYVKRLLINKKNSEKHHSSSK